MSGRFAELLLILLIVFVLFGAGKLPQVIKEMSQIFKPSKSSNKKALDEEGGGNV